MPSQAHRPKRITCPAQTCSDECAEMREPAPISIIAPSSDLNTTPDSIVTLSPSSTCPPPKKPTSCQTLTFSPICSLLCWKAERRIRPPAFTTARQFIVTGRIIPYLFIWGAAYWFESVTDKFQLIDGF